MTTLSYSSNYVLSVIGICLICFSTSILSLTVTMPASSNSDPQSNNEMDVNYTSYITETADLSNAIAITYLGYGNPQLNPFSPIFNISKYVEPQSVILEVVKEALFYPNPFSLAHDTVQIGIELTKDIVENSLEIHLYDMKGFKVFEAFFQDQILGGSYQKLNFSEESFGKPIPKMSSGVYVYLLMHEGEVLSKGKIVVKP
ncbi:hypothetical protein CL657_03425 [bacterium]|nr:hypothetical protein [bacterium]